MTTQCTSALTLFDKNTMLLTSHVRDRGSAATVLDSATATAQIKDAQGTDVGSPITLSYVATVVLADGLTWYQYEGAVPHTVGLTVMADYTIAITVTQSGLQVYVEPELLVVERPI